MKVLFAVQDEQISTKIVKEYQKRYKEIISYKNIYYFSAIIKELQRNKTYDRIVIDEELEEFNSNNYDQRDKFIFDKLDDISDEASNTGGEDIPIILICSERRKKSEEIFVKLFGLGIYNAIIGNDRSTEEVCRLIERPRSKKQAKIYYRIDSDEVKYKPENEDDVSEEEMQNILIHFKKLGNKEDQFADSFRRISSQYNDNQLQIIINILPLNVRAVLEETSPEYQKLVSNNRVKKVKKQETEKKSGTVEKLLKSNNQPSKITRQVVVPTTMKKDNIKRLTVKKPVAPIEFDDFEEDEILEPVQELSEENFDIEEKPKRGRGRPRKNPVSKEEVPSVPKKRGRPRKNDSIVQAPIEEVEDDEITELPGFDDIVEDEEVTELPGFDDVAEEEEVTELPGFDDVAEEDEEVTELPGFDDIAEEDEEEITELPGFDDVAEEEEVTELPGFDDVAEEEEEITELPGFDDMAEEDEDNINHNNHVETVSNTKFDYDDSEFENLLSSDKKIVAFVGTSKNGTSFIVNNLAHYFSSKGINTAILDTTQNKNSYYIYTKNEEELRKIASESVLNLQNGLANGIKVNQNLSVYTSVPNGEEAENVGIVLETLLKNHSLVLIDCDFYSQLEYFAKSQEIYLIQSMDILTIQPLTAFLRELKAHDILNQSKLKIVLNKVMRLKSVSSKNIIGGMAFYNDPEMSFMTELFDRNTVKYIEIPFDNEVYANYLDGIVQCEININKYPKNFLSIINELSGMVYPLLPNNQKQEKNKRGYEYSNGFSSSVNNTLNNMKKRY